MWTRRCTLREAPCLFLPLMSGQLQNIQWKTLGPKGMIESGFQNNPTYHTGLQSEKGIIFYGLKPVSLKTCLLSHLADLAEQCVIGQRKELKKGR